MSQSNLEKQEAKLKALNQKIKDELVLYFAVIHHLHQEKSNLWKHIPFQTLPSLP